MLQSQMRNYIQILSLFELPTKSLVIDPITLTFQRNVNASWYALIKRHAILFIVHTRSHNFGISLGGVVNLFKLHLKVPRSVQWDSIRRLCRPLKELKWL